MATRTGLAVGGIVRVGGSFWGSGETWSLGRRLQLFLVRLPILVASRGWIEDADASDAIACNFGWVEINTDVASC
jgi:hypothetical protein